MEAALIVAAASCRPPINARSLSGFLGVDATQSLSGFTACLLLQYPANRPRPDIDKKILGEPGPAPLTIALKIDKGAITNASI